MKNDHLMQNKEKDKLMVLLLQNKNNAIFYIIIYLLLNYTRNLFGFFKESFRIFSHFLIYQYYQI